MRRLLTMMALACSASAIAQSYDGPQLDAESQNALSQLRLERLRRVTSEQLLDEKLKSRLLRSESPELLGSALRDLSAKPSKAAAEAVHARTTLFELSKLATDDSGVAASLKAYGIEEGRLKNSALSADPLQERENLSKRLGVTRDGRLVVRNSTVLITKPEPVASDDLVPGQTPAGWPADTKPVWRRGLKFAALLARSQSSSHKGFCSATIIGQTWAITAAHCLIDVSGKKLSASEFAVFLPFEGGHETVITVNGNVNKNMRRVRVTSWVWRGEDTQDSFPTSEKEFGQIIADGKDLALLKLDATDLTSLAPVAKVSLYSGSPTIPPLSMVGYGVTERISDDGIGLLVGLRDVLPYGIDEHKNLLQYRDNELTQDGGVCGGDSGGGLFAGRMDGTSHAPRLIGVISGLIGKGIADNATFCLAHSQIHTSLLTAPNRKFVCERVPEACT